MNETIDTSVQPAMFAIGHCEACGTYTYPPQAYGCRQCGAALLRPVSPPAPAVLRNYVTLYTALTPELDVPCVIGEVELAPGVVEEALIHVADESELCLGQQMEPQAYKDSKDQWRWRFVPVVGGVGDKA
ncbi:Zn-ribbon domain-containing OB-fold protein [Bordetella muralis]|jgi:uncharacterized OB-fold protein|uniref:Zn-ribbon domain-containing OB-fold protein n=1 Tax=Bordetella muralis TaxID=1649130 RepID=UPI0039EF667D